MTRLPLEIRQALDATGRAWQIVPGSKHKKVLVDGHLVCILPRRRNCDKGSWGNIVAQIKRHPRKGRA